jgi:branched-chain amino acid transport system ATP-binding protein
MTRVGVLGRWLTPQSWAGIVLAAVVGVSLLIYPVFADAYGLQVMYRVLQLVALAQAWNLMAGYGGLVSLAPAAFIGIGSYTTAKLSISAGMGVIPAMAFSGVAAVIFALLVSVPMFRFRGLYFTIASLVLASALQIFMTNWSGLGGGSGLVLTNIAPTPTDLYLYALVLAGLATAVSVLVVRSRLGIGLMAIRDNEDVAQEVGVITFRTKLWAWLLGSLIFGLVGGLQAQKLAVIDPGGAFTLQWTIDIIFTVIIGGLGTIVGPILGAVTVTEISEQLADYPEWHVAITGAIAVLAIRFAPFGLWGAIKRFSVPRLRRIPVLAPLVAPAGAEISSAGAAATSVRKGPLGNGKPSEVLLEAESVSKAFGGVKAVQAVNLTLTGGEVLGLIGPNGAGKSTLVSVLNGATGADSGVIRVGGEDVTSLSAARRARLGIGRAHQIPRPFEKMTVLENLLVARQFGGGDAPRATAREASLALLERTGLSGRTEALAEDLTLLELKRLELARALAIRPRILMLDEIAAGLVESEVNELVALIKDLRDDVEGILVIEHVLDVIRECCDRVVVLNQGAVLTEGTPNEVFTEPEVIAVYLGTSYGERPAAKASRYLGAENGPLLELRGVSASYGSHRALHEIDVTVNKGEVIGVLGVNGAGKTTLARVISGMLPAERGEVHFNGKRIDRLPAHRVTRRGLAHCMEGRQIFGDLTVEENLMLAANGVDKAERARRLEDAYELFDVLAEKRGDSGASLSGGQQQMLAIARSLMAKPTLAIFDEISLGLAPVAVDRLYAALGELNERGVSLLVIEQDVERGLTLADRVYVLEKGRVGLSGAPDEVRDDERLKALYVGEAVETQEPGGEARPVS